MANIILLVYELCKLEKYELIYRGMSRIKGITMKTDELHVTLVCPGRICIASFKKGQKTSAAAPRRVFLLVSSMHKYTADYCQYIVKSVQDMLMMAPGT